MAPKLLDALVVAAYCDFPGVTPVSLFRGTIVEMPAELPGDPPDDAPDDLKAVWYLVLRWGESDDVGRGALIEAASDEELTDLLEAIDPLFPAINGYLDATGDAERAVPYGDLAQAAMEARFELDRRST
jgi:hypothetical protein